jgi:hypothetical protein
MEEGIGDLEGMEDEEFGEELELDPELMEGIE